MSRRLSRDAAPVMNRNVRALLATCYPFDAPFVVDHTAYRTAFGGHVVDWDEVIQTTLSACRSSTGAERNPL